MIDEEEAAYQRGRKHGSKEAADARAIQYRLRAERDTMADLVAGIIGGMGPAGRDFWQRTRHLWPEAARERIQRGLDSLPEQGGPDGQA